MELPIDTVAVPVASKKDATITCSALRPYLSAGTTVVVIFVIKKAGGGIDPTPVELQKRHANHMFDECYRVLSGFDGTIETTIAFHTDVVEGILEATRDSDADVIAFTLRGTHRLLKFISGDTAIKLIHRTDRPVLVLPAPEHPLPEQA